MPPLDLRWWEVCFWLGLLAAALLLWTPFDALQVMFLLTAGWAAGILLRHLLEL